jgi:DNA-binding response OmpR family regulator
MVEAKKAKILLVDDDKVFDEMYKLRLEASGYDVVVVEDGEKALVSAMEVKPDLILLDIMMPKINGLDVLDILKSTPETKDIPVIILTALLKDVNEVRGLMSGAAGYLVKSEVTPAQVVEKIESVLQKKPK